MESGSEALSSASAWMRCRAFARCAAALHFDRGPEAALREIVAVSLRRTHRWTGAGCAIAAGISG